MAETWHALAEIINRCDYLYLRWIGEPAELKLRLVIEEAKALGRAEPPPGTSSEITPLWGDAYAIGSNEDCRLFELIFDQPISYSVLNESYGKFPEPPETFTGKYFRTFSWSYLLELTRKTTYASDEHPGPGPLQHYEIACLNHVIDVITTSEPEIHILQSTHQFLVQ